MHVPPGSDDPLRDRLLALAAETLPSRPLPGAGELLWKAEIRRALAAQQSEESRIVRPALWGQAAGAIVGAATVLLFAGMQIAALLGGHLATGLELPLSAQIVLFSAAPAAAVLILGWKRTT